MADKLLNKAQVRERTGLGHTTIWRKERAGEFPRRRQVGPGRVAWLESEVDAWITDLPTAAEDPADAA